MTTLEIRELSKSFNGLSVFENLSLNIECSGDKGKIVGLLGPNGAGKTTLFNIVTGVYRPTKGEVFYNNQNITLAPPYKIASLGITRTFQDIRLFPKLSVLDNVLLGAKPNRSEGPFSAIIKSKRLKEAEERNRTQALRILSMFKDAGLVYKIDQFAENLSYGQQKLVSLARSLMPNPKLLLLDEPATGLDDNMLGVFVDLMKELKRQGLVVILIEHRAEIIWHLPDEIIFLSGKIFQRQQKLQTWQS